jgi:hypothetical protein
MRLDGCLFHVGSQLKGAVIYRAGSNDLVYIHSDHLGSVGATTAASGTPTTASSRSLTKMRRRSRRSCRLHSCSLVPSRACAEIVYGLGS